MDVIKTREQLIKDSEYTVRLPDTVTLKQIYSVLIALIPVVAYFKIPILGFGFGTLIVGITAPYPIVCILKRMRFAKAIPVLLLILYMLLRSLNSLTDSFLLIMVLIHVLGAFNGSVDIKAVRNTVIFISVLYAFFVFIQSFLYYVFGTRTSMLVETVLLDNNKHYAAKQLIETGLYRPCALFLEPSHYARYCSAGLGFALFSVKNKFFSRIFSVIITVGVFLTTSGIGIALCIGFIIASVFFRSIEKGVNILYFAGMLLLIAVVFVILMQIPFFNSAVQRVIGEDETGYNAIWGRTLFWKIYITPMSLKDSIIGYGNVILPDGYMTSLMSNIYMFGYINVLLYGLALLSFVLYAKNRLNLCFALSYAALFGFSGETGFLSLVFWFAVMIGFGDKPKVSGT